MAGRRRVDEDQVGGATLFELIGNKTVNIVHVRQSLDRLNNNRGYHQEIMHVLRIANRLDRDPSTSHIGTTLWDPYIDYATLARSMGMYAEGPISDPAQLGRALRRALEVVKEGSPALVDVVTQPR